MITTVEELTSAILDKHWIPDGTEVRRANYDGVMTTSVIELETGFELLNITEEKAVVHGEPVGEPEPGFPGGADRGLSLPAPRE